MKIVSACLAGIKCRYDGGGKPCQKVIDFVSKNNAIPICPEQLGGLPTPRPPAEQQGNCVITKDGRDITHKYARGARQALKIAQLARCKEAILKSKSPMCGVGEIYDGTFTGTLTMEDGICARLFKKYHIDVKTEKDL